MPNPADQARAETVVSRFQQHRSSAGGEANPDLSIPEHLVGQRRRHRAARRAIEPGTQVHIPEKWCRQSSVDDTRVQHNMVGEGGGGGGAGWVRDRERGVQVGAYDIV